MAQETRPNVVFVLGGPGSGKGTQCNNIVKEFGYVHLSAGDLLREEQHNEKSQYKELIERCIRDGDIVPVAVTCSLLEQAMQKSGKNRFLIDGFPRNQDNLDGWDKEMAGKVNLQFVLFFDCPQEVCTNRCLDRGKAGSGRTDDNAASLVKRFQIYLNDTMPIVKHFEVLDLVRTVDATASTDQVFEDVKRIFNKSKSSS